jgi:hypothetical protein
VHGFDKAIHVCNFEQTATTWAGNLGSGRIGALESAMSKTDEFWQYAKEAVLSASRAKTDDERHGLLDLARTWTQAALVERHLLADNNTPTIAA